MTTTPVLTAGMVVMQLLNSICPNVLVLPDTVLISSRNITVTR